MKQVIFNNFWSPEGRTSRGTTECSPNRLTILFADELLEAAAQNIQPC